MKLLQSLEIIIKEESDYSLNLRRRLNDVDELIEHIVYGSFVCDFDSAEQFVEAVLDEVNFAFEGFFNRLNLSKSETLKFLRENRLEIMKRMFLEIKKECK